MWRNILFDKETKKIIKEVQGLEKHVAAKEIKNLQVNSLYSAIRCFFYGTRISVDKKTACIRIFHNKGFAIKSKIEEETGCTVRFVDSQGMVRDYKYYINWFNSCSRNKVIILYAQLLYHTELIADSRQLKNLIISNIEGDLANSGGFPPAFIEHIKNPYGEPLNEDGEESFLKKTLYSEIPEGYDMPKKRIKLYDGNSNFFKRIEEDKQQQQNNHCLVANKLRTK